MYVYICMCTQSTKIAATAADNENKKTIARERKT